MLLQDPVATLVEIHWDWKGFWKGKGRLSWHAVLSGYVRNDTKQCTYKWVFAPEMICTRISTSAHY